MITPKPSVKTSFSQQFAHQSEKLQEKKPLEEIIPSKYHKFLSVFSKQESTCLPERKAWDHAIDLKEGTGELNCKVYPMNPKQDQLLKDFLKEHLNKGYIRPSKSPIASPFFFVAKKESDVLRMHQRRIPRTTSQSQQIGNRPHQTGRDSIMANSWESETYTTIPRIHRILLKIH